MVEVVDDTTNLSMFQQWSLFYFLKNKGDRATAETLADNMCLTAVIGFDTDKVVPELHKLAILGHIEEFTDENGFITYGSNLKGRFFVKQNFLAPLIKIKADDRIKEIIDYLRSKSVNDSLIIQLETALNQQNQNSFLDHTSNLALNKFVPFMSILDKLTDYLNSPQGTFMSS